MRSRNPSALHNSPAVKYAITSVTGALQEVSSSVIVKRVADLQRHARYHEHENSESGATELLKHTNSNYVLVDHEQPGSCQKRV